MDKMLRGFYFLIIKPYRLCFLIAAITLFIGLVNLHRSYIVKDYIENTGVIDNIESVRVLRRHQYVTEYNYDLTWFDNGEEYKKHFSGQVNLPEEGIVTIWVRPDNRDAVLHNSFEIKKEAPLYLIIALVTGVLGIVILFIFIRNRRESNAERIERLEDTEIYSMVGFIFCIVGIVMYVIMEYIEYKQGEYISPVTFDGIIAIGVIAVICLIMFFRARKQLKH